MTFLDTAKALLEASLQPSPTVIFAGLAIVVLVPILLHFILVAATPYSTLPSVLLVGPSGAGKTALLTLFERGPLATHTQQQQHKDEKQRQLNNTAVALTHTSQAPATVELSVSDDGASSFRDDLDAAGSAHKKFLLVDTPGHAKLRRHALARIQGTTATTAAAVTTTTSSSSSDSSSKSKVKAVVFVVDAAALADGDALPETAGYLYEVLLSLQKRMGAGKGSRAPASVPVLVAANKLDLFTALPAALVRSNLEAELGRIRRTRSRGLLDSGVGADEDVAAAGAAGDESDNWLGEYGSDKFSFKQMLEFDIEVDVVGGNVIGEGPGADRWWRWIAERI
ncbi:hypothetical protein B0T26DRAFT_741450 [Lasiosphaeria miniovina]|uniref:Signal recognition particle receptor subunit beta n=1 Tax=Lasiosphaeria miniovina TaxID=1954250 RepID=A0AA40AMG6_9PEZI|nr:uncharacterized protein B0T26DRAFT_741450 [Lasiosphaeria miniovina]KAK0718509.1 hypothetical protein B0T26DRAFT_741450 [Lasiosphaeria miniovina]